MRAANQVTSKSDAVAFINTEPTTGRAGPPSVRDEAREGHVQMSPVANAVEAGGRALFPVHELVGQSFFIEEDRG